MTDLTHAQATELAAEINALLSSAYDRLLAFYEGRGWLALGYASFADCAYPVFHVHHAMLYRRLNAAQHTDALGVPVLPEHAQVLNAVDADKRGKVIEVATQLARARGKDTFAASDLARAAVHVTRPSIYGAWLERGDVTAVQAVHAEDAICNARTAASWLADLAQHYNLHNVKAILALSERWHAGSETCEGIAASGHLEIWQGKQVPLAEATEEIVLQAWQVARSKHVDENRDYTHIEYVGLHTVDAKQAAATLRRVFDSVYLKQLVKELDNV